MSKTYDTEKLNEDLEVGVRGLYQDNGYFKVLVAPNGPILENWTPIATNSAFRSLRGQKPTAKPSTSPSPSKKASATRWAR